MAEFSKHQQKIIKNYYDNRSAISLQRVQELITELYLSEGKKRQRYWDQISSHLGKLGVPQSRIDQLVAKDNPEQVAKLVQELMDQK
ncbi:MAG: hypothetical protein FJ276_30155 [Planctomycetes bacterium]|nr:hypothetical protein [Planctomycetota bacterium]